MGDVIQLDGDKTSLEFLKELVDEGEVDDLVIAFTKKGSSDVIIKWRKTKSPLLLFMAMTLLEKIKNAIWY